MLRTSFVRSPCASHGARVALTLAALACASARASAQQGNPDVYLASLVRDGGALRVTTPRNITARPGYDNQPAFSRDGAFVYFTSTREDAQADIYRFSVVAGTTTRVTHTAPESEYSASEVPGGGALSVIRVERDSTQRLWRLPLSQGGAPEAPYLPALKPVGYHAWADSTHLVLFVLGAPSKLVVGDVTTGRADTVTEHVGRSLHRIPGTNHVSFVSKASEERWSVMDLDVTTRQVRPLVPLPKGTEDYAWFPDGRLVAGSGSRLLIADPKGDAAWRELADLAADGLTSITRIAVSPAGDRLAIVAVPAPPQRPR